jgi:hypothetical protein
MINFFNPSRQRSLQLPSFASRVWREAAAAGTQRNHVRPRLHFVLALALLLGLAGSAFSQPTFLLPASSQKAAFPGAFDKGRSFPAVSNGFLISFTREINAPGGIVLNNLSTAQDSRPLFWLPGASKITLQDAAVTPDKRFLLLTGTFTPELQGNDAPFIAAQELSTGKVSVITPAGDFVPVRVCATADNTIWALGQTQAEIQHIEVTPQPEYEMVRNYALDGTLRNSFVPRSSQGALPINLLALGRAFGRRLGTNITPAKLSCGDRSVGVFVGFPVHSWSEIDLKNKTVQQWKLKPLPNAAMTGLALLGSNTVYASFAARAGNGRPVLTLSKLTLTPNQSGEWLPVVDKSPPGQNVSVLLGRDGTSLVYLRGRRNQANTMLFWSKP